VKVRRLKPVRPSRAVVAWVAALTVAGAVEVWLHLQTTELGYQLSALHKLIDRLGAEDGVLRKLHQPLAV